MSDIAQKLGAELVKRFRDGTLNGQGGILVKQAAAEMERIEREEAQRITAGQIAVAARLFSGETLSRELQRLAAVNRPTLWLNGNGEGI